MGRPAHLAIRLAFLTGAALGALGCDPIVVVGQQAGLGAAGAGGGGAVTGGNAPVVPWVALHEGGTLDEWLTSPGGWQYVDAGGTLEVSSTFAHGGSQAIHATTTTDGESLSQAAVGRNINLTVGRYGAWYYFPTKPDAPDTNYWVLMKLASWGDTRVERFDIDVTTDATGTPRLMVYEHNGAVILGTAPTELPIGAWTHIEVRYAARPVDGRLIVLQDGVTVYDSGLRATADDDRVSWAVGSIAYYVRPSPIDVYIDDATIDSDAL